jgi:penicillin-binding protein 1A
MPQIESAFISLRPKDGAILSLVGGFDFDRSKFNHVTQAQRQPGSSFKPFIYSAALEKGFTPATIVNDAPFFVPADKAAAKRGNRRITMASSMDRCAFALHWPSRKTWSPCA